MPRDFFDFSSKSFAPSAGFLLDTNILSYAIRGVEIKELASLSDTDVAISSITWVEIMNGLLRLDQVAPARAMKLRRKLGYIMDDIIVLPFDEQAATQAARFMQFLKGKGLTISFQDSLIATHAFVTERILISHDQHASFKALEELGLVWRDWLSHKKS